jgi:type II secretory pathway component PulK
MRNNRGGVVFILVIWVMVILIAIAGEFSYSMRTELNITRNFKEEEESYQSALAGIELAKLEILSAEMPFIVHENEEGILLFGEEDETPVRKGELGNSTFSYTIIDEGRKLNINRASLPQLNYGLERFK